MQIVCITFITLSEYTFFFQNTVSAAGALEYFIDDINKNDVAVR